MSSKARRRSSTLPIGVVAGLNNHLKDTQTEVTSLRARVKQLEKKNADLKVNKKEELDKVEQRGSNLCFEGQIEAFKKIQGRLFQAGYDFGLNEVLIPPTSALRVPISILGDFKYADDEEDDGDEDSSQTGGQEALAGSAAGA